jgi:hypothetical protein
MSGTCLKADVKLEARSSQTNSSRALRQFEGLHIIFINTEALAR